MTQVKLQNNRGATGYGDTMRCCQAAGNMDLVNPSQGPVTGQVQLRGIHFLDAPAVTRLLEGDIELALQTAAIPIPYTLQCARDFLATADPQNNLAVTVEGELIGMIGLMVAKEPVEIGYWIGRRYWSRGFATAAVALLLREARGRGFTRLAAEIFRRIPHPCA